MGLGSDSNQVHVVGKSLATRRDSTIALALLDDLHQMAKSLHPRQHKIDLVSIERTIQLDQRYSVSETRLASSWGVEIEHAHSSSI